MAKQKENKMFTNIAIYCPNCFEGNYEPHGLPHLISRLETKFGGAGEFKKRNINYWQSGCELKTYDNVGEPVRFPIIYLTCGTCKSNFEANINILKVNPYQ